MRFPDTRAGESCLELVRLPELKTQAPGGGPQGLIAHALGPQGQHTCLVLGEILALALGEAQENALVALLGGLHQPALGPPSGPLGKSQHLVHDAQMTVVVDQPTTGIHLGVYLGPEEDVRLERYGPGETTGGLGQSRRAPQQRCDGDEEDAFAGHRLSEPFSSWQSFPWACVQPRHASSNWPRVPNISTRKR